MELSTSDDAEASMISKLKHACGFDYTKKLQNMYQVGETWENAFILISISVIKRPFRFRILKYRKISTKNSVKLAHRLKLIFASKFWRTDPGHMIRATN